MKTLKTLLQHDENGLLPCPMCNGEASRSTGWRGKDEKDTFEYIECLECTTNSGNKSDELWNQRSYIEPLRNAMELIGKMRELLLFSLSKHAPELNPSNYTHDDACELNANMIESYGCVEQALALADEFMGAASETGGEG